MAADPTTAGGSFRASGPDLGSGAGVPPHDLEAESSVLGAILLAERWLDPLLIDVGLRPGDFYRERHRLIYRAIIRLQEASEPIDTLTVAAQLAEDGEIEEAGGKEYIETLPERIPSIANTRQYGQIVKENSLLRNLLRASQEIQESISTRDGDPKELLERAQQRVFEVAHDNQSGDFRSIGDVLHDELEKLEKQSLEGAALTGTPSGFRDIDELTGGFQKGNLIIIAARPSMGKSALVTNIAENAALGGFPVALFSLEMSQTELAQRFVASQAKIDGDALRKGKVKKDRWPAVLKAAAELSESPLWIDDSSDINILELRAKARRLHGKAMASSDGQGLGLVIVDYLQLLRANDSRESRVEQVAQISRGLKILARELDIPVIAVSQLSRAVESRHPPRPQLSDLRECVTGDTLVWLADGRRVPIESIVGEQLEVLAINEHDRTVPAFCDKVWCVGRKDVFEVRLASGRSIKATAKHRVRTGRGWVEIGDLSVSDRVAVARSIPEPANAPDWSDDRIALLGQMIGDGSYLSGQPMRYTSASSANSETVTIAAEREFDCKVTRYDHRPNWHQLLISGNGNRWKPAGVNAWFRELGIFGQRSGEKRVPGQAFQLSNRQIGLLLRHLWATDGSIYVGERSDGRRISRVAYSSSSAGLASDVSALLLRLGVVARINSTRTDDRGKTMHHVLVSGAENQQLFVDQIGLHGPRVDQGRRLLAYLQECAPANTNVDTLPIEAWDRVKATMRERGITQRAMATARGASYGGTSHFKFAPSRETIRSYGELLDDSEHIRKADDSLFWDRVVEVSPLGQQDVFDLTVPGPANWLANNGIVTHNSGQIEQDADLVAFIYREDYYLRDESQRPGEADIIVAKHRNGPVRDVALTFISHYPKFSNLPRGYSDSPGGNPDRVPAQPVSADDGDLDEF
ncbi:MAG: replicative DNA helicase [Solirubrobacterales bacterium]